MLIHRNALLPLLCAASLLAGCGDDTPAGETSGNGTTSEDDSDDSSPVTMSTTVGATLSGGSSSTDPGTTTEPDTDTTGPGETTIVTDPMTSTSSGSTEGLSSSSTAFVTTGPSCDDAGVVVEDGGFEAGPGGGTWDEASDNFGTPLCDLASCGTGGGTGPFAGDIWAWFGGIPNVDEEGSVAQDVHIPTESETLSFWFELPVSDQDGMDTFEVTIDGDVIFSADDGDFGMYDTYTFIQVDITDYADGGIHPLVITGFTTSDAADEVTNFFVDNVRINCMPIDPTGTGGDSTTTGDMTTTGDITTGTTTLVTSG